MQYNKSQKSFYKWLSMTYYAQLTCCINAKILVTACNKIQINTHAHITQITRTICSYGNY